MQTEYAFDVFMSYSSHDQAWVRGELLQGIEQAGLKAIIHFRDFTRGAPSIKEMERGVVQRTKSLGAVWAGPEREGGERSEPSRREPWRHDQ